METQEANAAVATNGLEGNTDVVTDNQTPADNQTQDTTTDGQQNPNGTQDDNTPDPDGKYGSPETYDYSNVNMPDGMQLDNELLKEFTPLAKELNLSNDSASKLVALGVKLAQKNAATFKDATEQAAIAEKNSYLDMLNHDQELNVLNTDDYGKYLDVANQGYNAVATKEFKSFVNSKGLTHHPEFIKVFHKIGELCSDASIPDANIPPAASEQDIADLLYRNTTSANKD